MNRLKLCPPPPRDKRAVQYFAYPDWRSERLRETYPDGRYDAPANIGSDERINLGLQIQDRKLEIFVNDQLSLSESKAGPRIGNVGLFVDIGTDVYFSNLRVTSA